MTLMAQEQSAAHWMPAPRALCILAARIGLSPASLAPGDRVSTRFQVNPSSWRVQEATDGWASPVEDVRANHRRLRAFVAEKLLDNANVAGRHQDPAPGGAPRNRGI